MLLVTSVNMRNILVSPSPPHHFAYSLPDALVLAGLGAILTLGVDQLAHSLIIQVHDSNHGSQNEEIVKEGPNIDVEGASVEVDKYISGKCEHKCDHQHAHGFVTGENPASHVTIKAWIMEGAVAIHSVIIGFGFGILTRSDVGTIRILTTAFSIHQFFEGISLGTAVHESSFDKMTTAKFALTFSSTFPVGAILGMIVRSVESNTDSDSAILTQGVANAFAAGILLHTALCEMIPDDFSSHHAHSATHQPLPQGPPTKSSSPQGGVKFAMYLSLSLGFAIMSVLALWA
jgi:zinc transporter ZupT